MTEPYRQPLSSIQPKSNEGISDQVKALTGDLSDLATRVKDLTQSKLANAASDIQGAATATTDQYEAIVRRNPTQAALVAAGVGFLIGLLVTR